MRIGSRAAITMALLSVSLGLLSMTAPAAAFAVLEVQGEVCPPGTSYVTYDQAVANQNWICGVDGSEPKIGPYDIARLAGRASIGGIGYGFNNSCEFKMQDDRQLGNALCKPGPASAVHRGKRRPPKP